MRSTFSLPVPRPSFPLPLTRLLSLLLTSYASPPSLLKLGRFAVHSHYRGTGAGRVLEENFINHLKTRKPSPCCEKVTKGKDEVKVVAFSQCIAKGFYLRLGWETEGEEFLEVSQENYSSWHREHLSALDRDEAESSLYGR